MGIMCRGILKMVEPVECFGYGGICPGLGLDGIEEVARVDEDVWFLLYDLIYRFEKIVIDMLLAEVLPLSGSRRLNAAKPKWVSAMWMMCIVVEFYLGGAGI